MPLLNNPKLKISQDYFEQACHASRQHSALAESALASFGNHGAQISGCVREHFPPAVKEELRRLAGDVTRLSELARSNRPKRMHSATINRLGREVATRDGSGFYGPQPIRA